MLCYFLFLKWQVQVFAVDLTDARFFLKYLLSSSGLIIFTDTASASYTTFLRRFDDLSRSHALLIDMAVQEKKILPSLGNAGMNKQKDAVPSQNSLYTLNHIKFERSQSLELRKEILKNTLGIN